MSKTYAIVPAAGRGLRMGKDKPKQFLELLGESILALTLRALLNARFLSGIFLVVPADFIEEAKSLADALKGRNGSAPATPLIPPIFVIAGGAERQDSVFNGLRRLPDDCEWVLIHDGVRPFVSPELLEETRKAALRTGAAIAASPATDTVKRAKDGRVIETLRRSEIWLVQTPQVFRKEIVTQAYELAFRNGWTGTDDASFVERAGTAVSIAPGERSNIKVTTPEDLEWAEWFLARSRNARA